MKGEKEIMEESEPTGEYTARVVETGSRLHFGLFALGNPDWSSQNSKTSDLTGEASNESDILSQSNGPEDERRWFGGVGVMLKQPAVRIELRPASKLQIENDSFHYIEKFVTAWSQFLQNHQVRVNSSGDHIDFSKPQDLPVAIRLLDCGPRHSGLGVGTQLGLSVGQGLFDFFSNSLSVETNAGFLAKSVGRGLRSSVGTHGFFRGGLLVDRGKEAAGELGLLDGSFSINPDWRFVLIVDKNEKGLSGKAEKSAFQRMPEIPASTSESLRLLVRQRMVPAVLNSDFASFSSSLYEYGCEVGACFSSVQGGVFAGPRLTEIVQKVRGLGIEGIAQSSWGPTLSCVAKDPDQAGWLESKLKTGVLDGSSDVIVSEVLGDGRVGSAATSRVTD